MRIWFQTVTSNAQKPQFEKELAELCKHVAAPGTVVEIHGTPSDVGGEEYDPIRYLKVYGADGMLAAAITAERRGFDAFTIGNALDASLREARSLVNIPVVGQLETVLHMMSVMADKFSLIVSHHKFAAVWDRLIKDYGYKDRMVSIDALNIETTGYERLFSDDSFEERNVQRVIELGKKGVAAGAELIIVFPVPIFLRLAKRGVLEIDGAPVLNTIATVIKTTELMVNFQQVTGMFVSRKLTYANPPKELVDKVIARHKLQIDA